MTKQKMIEVIKQDIESASGYRYNSVKLAEIINAGIVPDGTVIALDNESKIVLEGNEIVAYENGEENNRMAYEGEMADRLLMMYAQIECKKF